MHYMQRRITIMGYFSVNFKHLINSYQSSSVFFKHDWSIRSVHNFRWWLYKETWWFNYAEDAFDDIDFLLGKSSSFPIIEFSLNEISTYCIRECFFREYFYIYCHWRFPKYLSFHGIDLSYLLIWFNQMNE